MPGLVRGSFTFGGNGYIMTADPDGSSQVSNLWKYNHTDDSWSIVSTAPFTLYNEIRFFIVDNTIHTVAGTELWKYDHENNQWLLVSPFVASPTPQMTVAGVTYGLNAGHNMIKFDPVLNTWVDEHSAVSYYPSAMTFFAVNGRGYVISTSAVLEFEP